MRNNLTLLPNTYVSIQAILHIGLSPIVCPLIRKSCVIQNLRQNIYIPLIPISLQTPSTMIFPNKLQFLNNPPTNYISNRFKRECYDLACLRAKETFHQVRDD